MTEKYVLTPKKKKKKNRNHIFLKRAQPCSMGCENKLLFGHRKPPSFSTRAAVHITLRCDGESVQTGEDAGVTLQVSKAGFPQVCPGPLGPGR